MGWSGFVGTCAEVPSLAGPRPESHDQKEVDDDDDRNYHQLMALSMVVRILSPLAPNWILELLSAFLAQSLATCLR